MEIHNLMEDTVKAVVDEVCDEAERNGTYGYCTSRPCRVDAICYVLNRIPPRYVSSGRGVVHVEYEYDENPQLHVDIYTLAHEALRRVTEVQRSYYKTDGKAQAPTSADVVFTFPTIKGRLFHALTFEPMRGIDIELLREGEPVSMVDARWQNPYRLEGHTHGTYMFHPSPQPTEEEGIQRSFEFEIRTSCEGFEPFRHFFEITVESGRTVPRSVRESRRYQLPDLYMLPK